MSNINNLKNIMFDLGGVLFPLSISATTDAYERNGAKDAAETFEKKLALLGAKITRFNDEDISLGHVLIKNGKFIR